MANRIGLTLFILTVTFYLCNCSDELQTKFDKKFMKIGSYGERKLIKINLRDLRDYFCSLLKKSTRSKRKLLRLGT